MVVTGEGGRDRRDYLHLPIACPYPFLLHRAHLPCSATYYPCPSPLCLPILLLYYYHQKICATHTLPSARYLATSLPPPSYPTWEEGGREEQAHVLDMSTFPTMPHHAPFPSPFLPLLPPTASLAFPCLPSPCITFLHGVGRMEDGGWRWWRWWDR